MANRETVGEFLIELGLDADDIDKKLNTIVRNVGNSLNNLVTGFVAPALAGLASADFVQQFADEITQVDRLSESLGISVEKLSAWRTAAEMAGVEADEVGELFADINDWMTDVKYDGSGTLYDYFEYGLLPAVTDANGELKNTENYILELADAFHNMDPAEASGIARKIGISNLQVAQWIQQGGAAIREQIEQAKELGVYTEEDTKAAKEFTAAINVLTHSLKMIMLPVFRAVAPVLSQIAKGFTEMTKRASPFIEYLTQSFSNLYNEVLPVLSKAFDVLQNNIIAFMPLLAGIVGKELIGLFLALAASIQKAALKARAFIFTPWGAVLMALLAIGLVLEDFITWLNDGESAWGEYYKKIFGSTDNAKKILQDFYNSVTNVFASIGKVFDELSPHFDKLIDALKNLFTVITGGKAFDVFTSVLIGAISLIIDCLASLINFLADNSNVIADFFALFVDATTSAIEAVTSFVEVVNDGIDIVITLITAFGSVVEQIGNVVIMIFNAMAGAFNTLVNSVLSGAGAIIGAITGILSKLAELASNSIFGKIIGSLGGNISAVLSGGSIDNSSTQYYITNNNTGSAAIESARSNGLSLDEKNFVVAYW